MKAPGSLDGKKASVCVERVGLTIRVDDVPANEAGLVAADILRAVRELTKHFPELVPELQPVPGGSPVEMPDDYWEEGRGRRVGFR